MNELSTWTKKRFKRVVAAPERHHKLMRLVLKWENRYLHLQEAIRSGDQVAIKEAQRGLTGVVERAQAINRKAMMADLLRAMDGCCYLCCKPITGEYNSDHITPRIKGGVAAGNLMPVHTDCNVNKDKRDPSEAEVARAREAYRIADIRFFDQDPKAFYTQRAQICDESRS